MGERRSAPTWLDRRHSSACPVRRGDYLDRPALVDGHGYLAHRRGPRERDSSGRAVPERRPPTGGCARWPLRTIDGDPPQARDRGGPATTARGILAGLVGGGRIGTGLCRAYC